MSTDQIKEKELEKEVPKYEPKVPTKAELIAFMEEQIEVNSVRVQLQRINTELMELLFREKDAQYKVAMLQDRFKSDPANLIDHVITEEDLENNPDLAKEGVKVGDLVKIPKNDKI